MLLLLLPLLLLLLFLLGLVGAAAILLGYSRFFCVVVVGAVVEISVFEDIIFSSVGVLSDVVVDVSVGWCSFYFS